MSKREPPDLPKLIHEIKASRKYRGAGIPDETVADILRQALARHDKPSEALRSAKAILHNVMAPYLGEPDYSRAWSVLDAAFASNNTDAVRQAAREILAQHDSTRERLPYLAEFYAAIRNACPSIYTVLDLACGLNPFALPWMGLPDDAAYHAYDIHQPRVELVNHFLGGLGLAPLAEARDVLVNPPQVKADAAFLFKEAHRIEKRRKGASRSLAQSLHARVTFISLPNRSLDRRRDLGARMQRLIEEIFDGQPGSLRSVEFPGETLYWLERGNG
jgi:16S rRNA (guanine(1405)-N(7))-methyltransferase